MEIGLRGWLIIGGILVIALILFDGWRRIRSSRNRIRLEIDQSVLADDSSDEALHYSNPELPNGGARRCNGDEARQEPRFDAPASAPTRAAEANAATVAEHSDRPVESTPDQASLRDMDPLFDDVPVEPVSRARPAAARRSAPVRDDEALDSAISQGEFEGLSLDGLGETSSPRSSSASAPLRASRDEADEPVSMSLDFDPEQPIPVLKDRISAVADDISTAAADGPENDEHIESEQGFSLDLDEPAASSGSTRTEPFWQESDTAPVAAESEPEPDAVGESAEHPSAERTEPQKRPNPEISADPEEMLVIFVVGRDKQPLPGAAIRKIVEACGMEFGEMGIYHRHERPNADGSLQFSMANAIQPGTFDLATLDSLETPAVTFFMSMRDPADPLYAYECMLATAETLCRHLDAELLDGDRSVMRPQTKEHYRERIHDFELHQRVQRTH